MMKTDLLDENVMTHESFSPEFAQWLATAPMDDLYQEMSDFYKEAFGIRNRWMSGCSREDVARTFVYVGQELKRQAQEPAEDFEDHFDYSNEEPPALPYEQFCTNQQLMY